MTKLRRFCIFCGGGRSAEHFWPEWMHTYLVKPEFRHKREWSQARRMLPSGIVSVTQPRDYKRQGGVHTKTIRTACKKCNNTWMSKIEEAAKSSFLHIFNDKIDTMNIEQLNTIRNWAALKIIAADHDTPENFVIPLEDCKEFLMSRKIPNYLKIYLGISNNNELSLSFLRQTATVSTGPTLSSGRSKNIQTTAFSVDRAFFYATACRAENLDPTIKAFAQDYLFPLQPLGQASLWPPPKRIPANVASGIANSLGNRLAGPHTHWVP